MSGMGGPPDLPKLRTQDNRFHRDPDPIVMLLEGGHEFIEEGLIGKLYRATESVAEELLAEVAHEGLPAIFEEVMAQAFEAFNRRPIGSWALVSAPARNRPIASKASRANP